MGRKHAWRNEPIARIDEDAFSYMTPTKEDVVKFLEPIVKEFNEEYADDIADGNDWFKKSISFRTNFLGDYEPLDIVRLANCDVLLHKIGNIALSEDDEDMILVDFVNGVEDSNVDSEVIEMIDQIADMAA